MLVVQPSVILAGQPLGVFYGNYFERDANQVIYHWMRVEGRLLQLITLQQKFY